MKIKQRFLKYLVPLVRRPDGGAIDSFEKETPTKAKKLYHSEQFTSQSNNKIIKMKITS